MVKPKLYVHRISPASRSCILTASAINLEIDIIEVNTLAKEQFDPEFLKMNPQHCVPTLNDNGQVLWESAAIIKYLATKYATKNVGLVPSDVYLQAKMDQRLHFNNVTLLGRYLRLIHPIFKGDTGELDQKVIDGVREALDFLEMFLVKDNYLVGNELTVADLSAITTVVTILKIIDIDNSKYPKTLEWIDRITKLPYYDDEKYADAFYEKFSGLLNAFKLNADK